MMIGGRTRLGSVLSLVIYKRGGYCKKYPYSLEGKNYG